jgi:hypothetical protein
LISRGSSAKATPPTTIGMINASPCEMISPAVETDVLPP